MQKEKLSALMDGELFDSEILNQLTKDKALQQHWQNYHLVRDTLRGDIASNSIVHLDIAARVASQLEKEPIRLAPVRVLESQPQPEQWQKISFWRRVRPWASQFTQIGVAACVSLAVIVGVQHYNTHPDETSSMPESPAFNTLPLIGKASPVSLGVPAESVYTGNGPQQAQEQRRRVNAMLQDYELQRRLHADQLQQTGAFSQQQAAIQVPGNQSLGTQQQ